MNLIIDSGNTRTKLGVFEGEKLLELHWTSSQEKDNTFWSDFVNSTSINQCIISNVNDDLTHLPDSIVKNALVMTSQVKVPIDIQYETPNTLGIDRLANAVAANHLFPKKNTLVLDMGTCIKLDMVDTSGSYLGGSISSGKQMRERALQHFTGKLPQIESRPDEPYIGKTTFQSINSGIFHAIVHEINGFLEQYSSNFNDLQIVGTGGDFHFFAHALKSTIFADDFLTLKGLNQILIYQKGLKD